MFLLLLFQSFKFVFQLLLLVPFSSYRKTNLPESSNRSKSTIEVLIPFPVFTEKRNLKLEVLISLFVRVFCVCFCFVLFSFLFSANGCYLMHALECQYFFLFVRILAMLKILQTRRNRAAQKQTGRVKMYTKRAR